MQISETITLKQAVDAVLRGEMSMNKAAKCAEVNVSTVRRLVIADTRYAAAVAGGKIVTKDIKSSEELQTSPLVVDVVQNNLTVAEAASKHGVSEVTVRARVRKAFPNFLKRNSSQGDGSHDRDSKITVDTPPSKGPKSPGECPVISWDTARDYGRDLSAIPEDLIEAYMPAAREHSQHSYILRIEDTGMTALPGAPRTFPVGCLVFVDGDRTLPQEGDRVIALVEETNKLTFRIFHSGNRPWLEPLNPMYEPIRTPFKVVGTVFGKWEDA